MEEMYLTRAGVIRVKPEQGTDCQCVVKGHTTYYFQCDVVFRDVQLDKKGFVIDQGELGAIIENFYEGKPVPSCELMVRELNYEVAKQLIARNMKPYSVYTRITNIPSGSQGYIHAKLTLGSKE